MKIGITGGIGSGKSYVCKLLAERNIEVYDCDKAAKRLMRESAELKSQLIKLLGPDAYTDDGLLNKAVVARFLLLSEDNAHAIDNIVHPAVVNDFIQSGMQWIESAILFESGISHLVDRVIVVTAPEIIRLERIMKRDNISNEKARQWMNRQWPQEKVRQAADFEIVNDGIQPLLPQLETILNKLQQ